MVWAVKPMVAVDQRVWAPRATLSITLPPPYSKTARFHTRRPVYGAITTYGFVSALPLACSVVDPSAASGGVVIQSAPNRLLGSKSSKRFRVRGGSLPSQTQFEGAPSGLV